MDHFYRVWWELGGYRHFLPNEMPANLADVRNPSRPVHDRPARIDKIQIVFKDADAGRKVRAAIDATVEAEQKEAKLR